MKKILTNTKPNVICALISIVLIIIINLSVFTIRQGEQASAFLFGHAQRDYLTPGLKAKYPWESVNKVDKRLLLHKADAMTLQDITKKNLLIDYFTLFKIDNPKTYFTKVGTMEKAYHRIDDHLGSDINAVLGKNTSEDIITHKRSDLLSQIKKSTNEGLDDIDISLQFVSFNRVELPNENKESVFQDMIADRNKISNGYNGQAKQIKDSIQSEVDFRVTQIISTAQKNASIIMGKADSIRLHTLNTAYAKSKELFRLQNKIETFKRAYAENTEWYVTPEELLPKYK